MRPKPKRWEFLANLCADLQRYWTRDEETRELDIDDLDEIEAHVAGICRYWERELREREKV